MVWIWMERVALSAAVVVPLLGSLTFHFRRDRPSGVASFWVAAACAALVTVLVACVGPVTVKGGSGVGLSASPVTAVLLMLVVGVGALVQSFSARNLQADPSRGRFTARAGLVIAAMALVVASRDLAGLVLGWVAAGAAFRALMGCRSDLPGVGECLREVRKAVAVSDGSLIAAATLIWWRVGDVNLSSPHSVAIASQQLGAWRGLVAALAVIAALARSGQGLFRRWLPLTVSGPTPTCALLHAGVINGGGILLVRFGVLSAWRPAMAGLLVVAGATAVWAGSVARLRPDVKGQLAFSTMAQMGFMLAECAVGAYPAAVIHLFGHGFYKASLFFSSGSGVSRPGLPTPPPATRSFPRAASVASVALGAALVPGVLMGEAPVLRLFAMLTAASLAGTFWATRPWGRLAGGLGWLAVLVVATAGYGAVVAALGGFLETGLASAHAAVDQWWLISLAAAGAAASWLSIASPWAQAVQIRLLATGALPLGRPTPARSGRYGPAPVERDGDACLEAAA